MAGTEAIRRDREESSRVPLVPLRGSDLELSDLGVLCFCSCHVEPCPNGDKHVNNRGLYEDSGLCFTGGGAWCVGYPSDRGAAGEVSSRRADRESERGGAGAGGL